MNFDYYSENQLYVSRFPELSTEEDLYKLFSPFGKIKNIMMKPGFAFIDYEKYTDADDCVFTMDGIYLEGKRMIVQHAIGDKKDRESSFHNKGFSTFNKKNDCCYHCGKKGHWAKECKEEDHYDKRTSYCFKCGDRRHVARYCPLIQSLSNRIKSVSKSNLSNNSRSRSKNKHVGRDYSNKYNNREAIYNRDSHFYRDTYHFKDNNKDYISRDYLRDNRMSYRPNREYNNKLYRKYN